MGVFYKRDTGCTFDDMTEEDGYEWTTEDEKIPCHDCGVPPHMEALIMSTVTQNDARTLNVVVNS
jgi:hypothetical protein